MEGLFTPAAIIPLITLTLLEIVLGVDNIIFISILASKLPKEQQERARLVGLSLALITRILLLLGIGYLAKLTTGLFSLPAFFVSDPTTETGREILEISGRDLILGGGGLFLIYKSVKEIHHKMEGDDGSGEVAAKPTFTGTIIQILILDVVFSLDSVITAVGMVDQVSVMIAAVIIAVIFMLVFSGKIAGFVEKHPTIKMLALSFLVLIGVNLLAESAGQHIPKGYTYFAMAFSVAVELLNLRTRGSKPVKLPLDEPTIG